MRIKKASKKKLIFYFVLTITGLWFGSGLIIYFSFEENKICPIGDMFGANNALFSGLALVGIIYTIYLQHEELKLQRNELKLTRLELKRSAEAQEKSQVSAQEQANALSYTAMLNTLNTLINSTIMQLEPHKRLLYSAAEKKIRIKKRTIKIP